MWSACLDNCLVTRSYLPEDDALQRKRKRIVIYMCLTFTVLCLSSLNSTVGKMIYSTIFVSVANTILLIRTLVFKRSVTDGVLITFSLVCFVALFVADINAVARSYVRTWPAFVIFLDLLLVCECGKFASNLLVAVVIVYLFVLSLESHLRFGLLDYPLTAGYKERIWLLDCDGMPPCPVPFDESFSAFLLQAAVFFLDFVITRRFAMTVLAEQRSMTAAITTAQSVAGSLAAFDLLCAEEALGESELPEGLRSAFTTLLANLTIYRPYLPKSCLPFDEGTNGKESSSETFPTLSTTACETLSSRELQKRKMSLLATNLDDSWALLKENIHRYSKCVAVYVATISEVTSSKRGVVEHFQGDRIMASFGASRSNVLHAASACEAVELLLKKLSFIHDDYGLVTHTGITTGFAHCGDLGCSDMLSFSILGRIVPSVEVIRSHAKFLGLSLLVDERTSLEIRHNTPVRVVDRIFDSIDKQIYLYELTFGQLDETGREWMYQLEAAGADRWDCFNDIARLQLTDTLSDDAAKRLRDYISKLDEQSEDFPIYRELLHVIEADNRPVPLNFQTANLITPKQEIYPEDVR
eukprot:TRINITY_DN1761_c0_g1_i6.p1 TRINITY_DN1761_c0_g1~~TRINITY_DN1761_c0_g1_i6.p1  ORF type:complete len:583 (+),score=74.04 TRINITY_DN1761_c0_g1_i6:116-1864(+)